MWSPKHLGVKKRNEKAEHALKLDFYVLIIRQRQSSVLLCVIVMCNVKGNKDCFTSTQLLVFCSYVLNGIHRQGEPPTPFFFIPMLFVCSPHIVEYDALQVSGLGLLSPCLCDDSTCPLCWGVFSMVFKGRFSSTYSGYKLAFKFIFCKYVFAGQSFVLWLHNMQILAKNFQNNSSGHPIYIATLNFFWPLLNFYFKVFLSGFDIYIYWYRR